MKTILIFLGVLLIGLVTPLAYNITAGESQSFDLGEVFDHYSITGNSTEVNITITQVGTVVIINISKYSIDNTFEIVFFNQEEEIIDQDSGGGTQVMVRDIEVPTQTDSNVTVEVEVEVEGNGTDIIGMGSDENKKDNTLYFVLLLIIVIIICFLIRFAHSKITERRLEKYDRRNETEEKIE